MDALATVQGAPTVRRSRDRGDEALALEFCVWMIGSRGDGEAVLAVVAAAAAADGTGSLLDDVVRALLGAPIRVSGEHGVVVPLPPDERSRTVGLTHPLVRGDPRRLRVLQEEMARVCLRATLLALPAATRAAFILTEILSLPFERVARVLGGPEALRKHHARALRLLDRYLGARCEHLGANNSCRCATRLGGALARGEVRWPTSGAGAARRAAPERPCSSVAVLYGRLRSVEP